MNTRLRGAVRAAIASAAVSSAFIAPAIAQQSTPQPAALEEVTVTGSLIKGAQEDAAIAVEVFTAEDLEAQGAPNIVEFTRSLTSSTEALGEPNIDLAGTAAGSVTVNLRGLGATRTMTLLNGHRTSGDVSFIPTNAIGRVEVLQEGAGVTYGAGAVGGVINFVTRTNFNGLELSAQHKFIDGSQGGESEGGFVWGTSSDRGSLMFAAQYVHQGRLNFTARDYGTQPFEVNPTQYLAFSSQPASYYLPGIAPAGATGTRVNDYTASSCRAVGGVQPNGTAECYYYYTPLFNFIDETENTRLFASGNFHVTDSTNVRFELGYSRTEVPETWAAPTLPPDPTRRGAAGTLGVCAFSTFLCEFQIPISVNGVQNPFVAEFYARNVPGVAVPASGSIYTGVFWEPWALNGNPLFDGGARYESRMTDRWGFSVGVDGDLGGFLEGIGYNLAVSGGMTRTKLTRRDIVVARMQNALRGYGGPNCGAVDNTPTDYTSNATYDATVGVQSTQAPGTNGCQWFNPFASSWPSSSVNGGANPSYAGAAFQNSIELQKWLMPDIPIETRNFDINVDLLFSGEMPEAIALPGGNIAWAFGGQYRSVSDRTASLAERELFDIAVQPCAYPGQQPGQRGCGVGAPGPFWATGRFQATKTLQEVVSVFGELRLPITDDIDAQLAARREDYNGFEGTVYKAALKWQALDWLAFRGSWSTNYAAPPANITDTTQVPGAAYITRFTTFIPTINSNIPGTGPERAVVTNFGALFNSSIFGEGHITASLDYFDFDIKDQIVNTSVTTVLNNVAPVGNTFSAVVNCSAPLITFVILNAPCGPTTTLNNLSQVYVYQTNGPGVRTSGLELSLDYFQPAFGGDIGFGVKATQVTKYEVEGYAVNGVQFDTGGDRLGYANLERSGDFSSKLRGNAYGNYHIGRHNIRAQVNYTKGVTDDRGVPVTYPRSTLGVAPHDYVDLDLHYRLELWWFDNASARLSVLNVTDKDPMPAQVRNGYYSGVGNARGRQIELGLNLKF